VFKIPDCSVLLHIPLNHKW